jgi:hypothetical protein
MKDPLKVGLASTRRLTVDDKLRAHQGEAREGRVLSRRRRAPQHQTGA